MTNDDVERKLFRVGAGRSRLKFSDFVFTCVPYRSGSGDIYNSMEVTEVNTNKMRYKIF